MPTRKSDPPKAAVGRALKELRTARGFTQEDLTPAISRTGAVKTGDSTQILPFICILIIAAGAIGGVVFYKKKNKNK